MSDVNQFVDLDQNDEDEIPINLELFPRDANHYTVELLDKLYRERYSRLLKKQNTIDPKKTTCMLYLQADHTFFDHYKSEEACIECRRQFIEHDIVGVIAGMHS
ncbi:hypothetical protein PV327_009908 [Microctonus hyperodae]|uniref:Uncharacterized protein n=1 Tax=Microctonus hyperodae TaxID=165561 RepID=A0AA39KG31_MICHY|nr:hypothetical protein PV327_009908 [Microctonus hyperodae]